MKDIFSQAELDHIASIMEANPISPTDPEVNRTARKIGNTDQVGSSVNTNTVSSRDLTDETIMEMPSQHRSSAGSGKNTNRNLSALARKLSMEKPRTYREPGKPSKAEERAEAEKLTAGKEVTKLPASKSRKLKEETEIAEDFEYEMARNELATAERAIKRLMEKLNGEGNLEAWVQSKITKAFRIQGSVI